MLTSPISAAKFFGTTGPIGCFSNRALISVRAEVGESTVEVLVDGAALVGGLDAVEDSADFVVVGGFAEVVRGAWAAVVVGFGFGEVVVGLAFGAVVVGFGFGEVVVGAAVVDLVARAGVRGVDRFVEVVALALARAELERFGLDAVDAKDFDCAGPRAVVEREALGGDVPFRFAVAGD